MKRRNEDFLLGLAVILFSGLFLFTFFQLYSRGGPPGRPITVYFRHTDGVAPLKKGSPILLAGSLWVGRVNGVHPEERDVPGPAATGTTRELVIVVDAEIDQGLVLNEGVQITTDQPAVGGGASVVILDVGPAGKPLDLTRPIIGQPPQSLAAAISQLSRRVLGTGGLVDQIERLLSDKVEGSLVYKISASLTDLNEITDSLSVQLTDQQSRTLIAKIHGILDDLNGVTGELRRQTGRDDGTLVAKVHSLLDRLDAGLVEITGLISDNRPVVNRTLANLESVTATLAQEMLPALREEFVRDRDGALLAKLHTSMDRLNESLSNVVSLSDQGRRMVLLNRPSVDRTVENLKEASEQLRIGVQELLLSPWKLFQQPGSGERERIEAFTAARRFAESAAYLNDATLRLQAVVASLPAGAPVTGDDDVRALQETLKRAFERFREAEDFLWERMKK